MFVLVGGGKNFLSQSYSETRDPTSCLTISWLHNAYRYQLHWYHNCDSHRRGSKLILIINYENQTWRVLILVSKCGGKSVADVDKGSSFRNFFDGAVIWNYFLRAASLLNYRTLGHEFTKWIEMTLMSDWNKSVSCPDSGPVSPTSKYIYHDTYSLFHINSLIFV